MKTSEKLRNYILQGRFFLQEAKEMKDLNEVNEEQEWANYQEYCKSNHIPLSVDKDDIYDYFNDAIYIRESEALRIEKLVIKREKVLASAKIMEQIVDRRKERQESATRVGYDHDITYLSKLFELPFDDVKEEIEFFGGYTQMFKKGDNK